MTAAGRQANGLLLLLLLVLLLWDSLTPSMISFSPSSWNGEPSVSARLVRCCGKAKMQRANNNKHKDTAIGSATAGQLAG
jgi:hypothetical protein